MGSIKIQWIFSFNAQATHSTLNLFLPPAREYRTFIMSTASVLSLADRIKQEAADGSLDQGHGHVRLLQLIDELKLAVETPTETILRLIYQVCN